METDVVIIGSGPAGLSAALYTGRAGLKTVILGGDTVGGLVTTTEKVDNYLGMFDTEGVDMAVTFRDHASKFGAELVYESASHVSVDDEGVFTTHVSGDKVITSKAVIYAAGSTPKKMGVPGENYDGVSYCATCDGLFYEDEPVAIVGGGESAVEEALYLSNMASSVDVLVRSDWRATEPAVEKLLSQPNVTVHLNSPVQEIMGEDDTVNGIMKADGVIVDVSGVFVAIGQSPNHHAAEGHVVLTEDGFISESNVDGFFVAGDIRDPEYRQVAIAVGDGAKAGIDATRFVQSK